MIWMGRTKKRATSGGLCRKTAFYLLLTTLIFVSVSGCSRHTRPANEASFNQLAFEHDMQGEQYLRMGKYSAALYEFQSASRISPNDWPPHYKAGIILEQQGRLKEAIEEYQTVIRLDFKELKNPADKARWPFRLAGALLKIGRAKEAKSEYMATSQIAAQDRRHDGKLAALAKQSLRTAKKLL